MENYNEKREFHPNLIGTPQGGVLPPLLLNIAFHGMEKSSLKSVEKKGKTN